jgi:hypothetical protein
MPVLQVRLVNFGKTRGSLTTVGYAIFDATGSVTTPRTGVGVYELSGSTGVYGVNATFPDNFIGSIIWDTGQNINQLLVAAETYDYRSNNPSVISDIQSIVSASIIAQGFVTSGSSTSVIYTTVSASTGFFTGYGFKVVDVASGSAFRFVDAYASESGTFFLDADLPFMPTSGSTVLILPQFDSNYGNTG